MADFNKHARNRVHDYYIMLTANNSRMTAEITVNFGKKIIFTI